MKLIYTLAALIISSMTVPAFADSSWDSAQQDNSIAQQVDAQQIAMTENSVGNGGGGMQFDTAAMNAQNAAAYQAYLESLAYQQQVAAANARNNRARRISLPTGNQRNSNLPVCQTALMTPGGLQATTLDSFVVNAGGQAELIYGDEGTSDIPPYFGFDSSHAINSGIQGNLTTGHASGLPGAWTSY